ncbi:MAG TPA: response regulator transcription factor [Actinophytocola sp.]|uniref:response regulator transcription factor n=1 Tax=Actinophytocola sp. TaxID=1872138 RepID=UPI002DB6D403|nr:response regulator transcription factor [Actinophytocola sp.]HEU5474195.1 response regulator transcription factor [Actinophytocola sp.]
MTKILAVEDEPDIVLALRLVFERAGYQFISSSDGRTGLRMVHEEKPDLVLLDIGLPGMDGWTVLERIRDLADLPVLMISAHGQESDKVRGLRAGADDYVTKPFTNNELLARAEALLRRSARPAEQAADWADYYDDGLVRINRKARAVHVNTDAGEREVQLTNTEFRLLNVLVKHAGAVLSAQQLLANAWDDPTGLAPDRVKFAVLRLRRKLGWDNAGTSSPIKAVRGVGYRYDRPG